MAIKVTRDLASAFFFSFILCHSHSTFQANSTVLNSPNLPLPALTFGPLYYSFEEHLTFSQYLSSDITSSRKPQSLQQLQPQHPGFPITASSPKSALCLWSLPTRRENKKCALFNSALTWAQYIGESLSRVTKNYRMSEWTREWREGA